MSWIQQQEELAYDTQSEYLAVLRAEHFDPYENVPYCAEHEFYGYDNEPCPHEHAPAPVVEPLEYDPADEPPF